MSCLGPVPAWRAKRLSDNGKRGIVFNVKDGFQDMPLEVPCGKCEGCKADKALEWAIRCYQEASLYQENCFVTLTYDDDHIPQDGNLQKQHLQQFFKKLRRNYHQFRYYACGEYGSTTDRPHYHALMFGTDFRNGSEYKINEQLYSVPSITETWKKGSVSISEFNMSTACYVAGYVQKKCGNEKPGEFQIMSRKPGIGVPWLGLHAEDIMKTHSVVIEGREYPVPRPYFRWAEDNMVEGLIEVKTERSKKYSNLSYEEKWERRREADAKKIHLKQKVQRQKEKQQL